MQSKYRSIILITTTTVRPPKPYRSDRGPIVIGTAQAHGPGPWGINFKLAGVTNKQTERAGEAKKSPKTFSNHRDEDDDDNVRPPEMVLFRAVAAVSCAIARGS